MKKHFILGSFSFFNGKSYASCGCVFNRVGKEIQDDLIDTCIVTVHLAGKIRIHLDYKIKILGIRSILNGINEISNK